MASRRSAAGNGAGRGTLSALSNPAYARALVSSLLERLPLGADVKAAYYRLLEGGRRAREIGLARSLVMGYAFSAAELDAMTAILDRLGIDLAAVGVLDSLREGMTRSDLGNLLALLAYVVDHDSLTSAASADDAVVRVCDWPPSRSSAGRRSILFVTGQFPNPIHGGGGRVSDFIKLLSRRHDVYLYSLFDERIDNPACEALAPYCRKLGKAYYHEFESNLAALREFIAGVPMDVVHYEWPRALNLYRPSWGKRHVFTYMEAVSLRLLMDLRSQQPFGVRWRETTIGLLNALKEEVIDSSPMDCHIVVTRKDGEFLARFAPGRTHVVVNTGVHLDEFCLPDRAPEPNTLIFTGNYGHYPNEDAVHYFFAHIYREIKRQVPEVKVYIAGANPGKRIRAYHDNRHVFVTGTVEDIRPYIQRAAVCVAPLINGAGIRGKVTQYAALKRVCVATSIAATDLLFQDGKDIYIADDPPVFAERVVYLLQHPQVARRMAESAYEKTRTHYDSRQLAEELCRVHDWLDEGL